jgi:hypothetical protein
MYYSPILFTEIADINLTQYHDCNIDMDYLNSKDKIIVFSVNHPNYLTKINFFLENIQKPFIIITAMEDAEIPLDIDTNFMNKIKNNFFFKHWFAINKTIPNDEKFTSIPYGLDYWTISKKPYFGENIQDYNQQNSIITNILNESIHFSKRIPKIYGNFHLNFNDDRHGRWRRQLLNIIPKDIIYYEESILKRSDSFKNISNYTFIVSPFGHGFDCIRTFEALCLGCIVIMKTSFLDIIYQDLPVLIVNEWSDINEKLLNDTLIEYSNKKFNYEKLKMEYWIRVVNSRFDK